MKISVVKGATSVLVRIFVQDSSSTTGGGLTGLAFNTSSLVCYRMRDDDGNAGATAISLATATLGTWASGGFKEKDATNAPGWYEFGIPNAAIATGSRTVSIHLKGATNMAPCPIEIELTGWDNQDAVHGGMSALPNTACTTNASLITSGTGTAQLSVSSGQVILQSGSGTGQLDFTSGVVKANATQWLGGTIPAVNVTGVPLVDAKYLLGTIFSTPATAGIPDVNLKNIANAAVSTSTAQLGVNVVNFGGSAGTFASGRPEVNTTHIRGTSSAGAVGYVGIDWSAVNAPTTTVALTGTTIATSQVIASVSGAVGSVTGAVGSVAAGGIASATFAADTGLQSIRSNTAQAGAASTITLDASASATTDFYKGRWIRLTGGTGAGQVNLCTAYNGSTKVATVRETWAANPDNTTTFAIINAADIQGVVLVDTLTTYTGNTVQTGDAFARIGLAGVGLTNLGDTRIANLDATISSRGTSTLTQTQVTGGAYALNSASFAFNAGLDFSTTQKTSLNAATPAVTVSDKTGFSLASGSIDVPTFSAAMQLINGQCAYVTGPATAGGNSVVDNYYQVGLTNNLPAFKSSTLGTSFYLWSDGSFWYISTTNGTAGTNYWKSTNDDIDGGRAAYSGHGTTTGSATVSVGAKWSQGKLRNHVVHGGTDASLFLAVLSTNLAEFGALQIDGTFEILGDFVIDGAFTAINASNHISGVEVSGDLSATMKTSVQTAADAAITANATIAEIESETDGIAAIPTSNPSAAAIAAATASQITTDHGSGSYQTATSVTVSDKTGFALASNGLNLVVPSDPSSKPTLGSASIVTLIGWFGAWSLNEVESTNSTVKLRNSADSADLVTHATSDDGTTFTSDTGT